MSLLRLYFGMALREQSDSELLAASKTVADAFGIFYDRHEASLLSFLVRATGNAEISADIAAETFATLLNEIGRDAEIREPKAWLYAVARRKLVDGVRRGVVDARARQRLGMQRIVLTDETLERINELGDDRSSRAREAFNDLPDDQRAAVQARVINELTYEEIASRLRCSEAVARKRVSRGLNRLRRTFQEQPS